MLSGFTKLPINERPEGGAVMELILYTANCSGNPGNCLYPNKAVVSNAQEMAAAVVNDHVCATYKDSYRNIDNFIESVVEVWDCDNDHSDDPADWITPEMLGDGELADVSFVTVPSRHNMLPKDGKSARPKFHLFAGISKCTSSEQYASIKKAVQKKFTFFDDNAVDAARFLFGSDVSADDIYWHEGWLQIDEVIENIEYNDDPETEASSSGPILEGSRNNTMSRFAGKVLKRYGICEKAHEVFLERAAKCEPPLEQSELNTIWGSAVKFFKNKVMTSDDYVPPEQYNDEFGGSSLKPDDYSDIGEAKVLTREYGDELKFTKATDYLRYDGQCWREDKEMALGAAEEFLDLQLVDARDEMDRAVEALVSAGIPEEVARSGGSALQKMLRPDQMGLFFMLAAAQAYLKFVLKYRNYKNIVNTQNAAKPMLAIDVNELDKDPHLINTPFATFNMKHGVSGEQPHDPRDLITKITTVSPGDAGRDIWEDALNTFFCGDKDLIDYVQQTVGIAAIGKVYQEHMIIAYGGGANGKSTFWNTIFRVLGNYAGKISAESLTMGCKRNVKPEMAELKGKRLIIASEMEEGMRLNTATVKQLCSTDEIQAEKKYKDPFHFVPSHTLVLYTNHLPKVGANDDGIWRRLVVIPFNAKITGRSDIKNYADYLFDHAGPSIMSWIIEGAKKAIAVDYHTPRPKVVSDAIQSYREDNDWLGQFIDECCDVDAVYQEKSGELYQSYRAYCIQNGEYTRSTTDFYSALDKAQYFKKKTNKGIMVFGLQLKTGQDFLS